MSSRVIVDKPLEMALQMRSEYLLSQQDVDQPPSGQVGEQRHDITNDTADVSPAMSTELAQTGSPSHLPVVEIVPVVVDNVLNDDTPEMLEIEETTGLLVLDSGHECKQLKGEDKLLHRPDSDLFGVFDGMGGHGCGDIAAATAAYGVERYFDSLREVFEEDPVRHMRQAFENALHLISEKAKGGEVSDDMGTTGTVVKFYVDTLTGKRMATYGHVGDSRLYKMRGQSIEQITTDEGYGHRLTNVLWADGARLEQFGVIDDIEDGDRFMICSDGITGDYGDDLLREEEIVEALSIEDPKNAAIQLIKISRKRDDKTAVVVDVHLDSY